MNREKIFPENKQHWLNLRLEDITSTEVSALFGLSPYMTIFELWHTKKNKTIVELDPNERMDWGLALEESIAKEACRINNWDRPVKIKEYIRIPEIKAGASFDFETFIGPERVLLEIKNVDGWVFKTDWKEKEEGGHEAPPHIELQAQHQLLVSSMSECYICALVGGNKLYLLRRKRNEQVIAEMIKKINEFWKSIDNNEEPSPNFELDAEYLIEMYSTARPESLWENADSIKDLAIKYDETKDELKHLEIVKRATKAEILTFMGDFEKAKGEGFSISAKVNKAGSRVFRVKVLK